MKSKLLVVVVFLFVAIPLQAQWNIGGVLNINLASISVNPIPSSETYSGLTGLGLGAVLVRPLTGQIDLHLEPMLLQKGATLKEWGEELAFKLSYFELPIMFLYNFRIDSSIKPYVMAGPSLGLLLSAKYKSDSGQEQDEKDNTKSLDLSLGVGGGVKIPLNKMTLFVEARYMLGLLNINNVSNEAKVKNRGLLLLFGVTIPLKK